MDIHQKKAAVVVAIASVLAYSFIVYALHLTFLWGVILLVCGLLFLLLFLRINRWMRPYLNGKEYPNNDWYRKHFERNYDILILGDDISRNKVPGDLLINKKVFDCSLLDQNLYADFLVLKNTFSILKPHGIVYLPLRKASIKYVEDKFLDERRYYWVISPYVFNTSSFSCAMKKVFTRIPGLLFRFKDLVFLFKQRFSSDYNSKQVANKLAQEKLWLESTPDNVQSVLKEKQEGIIDNIRNFCAERNLILVVIDAES